MIRAAEFMMGDDCDDVYLNVLVFDLKGKTAVVKDRECKAWTHGLF